MKKYIGKLAKVLLVSALCPLMQSCFNLDEEWYSEVTPDTFFKTKENIYSIANRPFTHGFWYEGIDRWYLQEYTADQMIQPQRGNDWFDGGIFFRLQYHTWTPDDGHIWQAWRGTGMGISLAMECKKDLEGLNYEEYGLTEADKQDHISQMNAMMGYFYLRALDYFGAFPIVEDPLDEVEARSTPEKVFAKTESLLKEALANTYASTAGTPITYQISQGAAATLPQGFTSTLKHISALQCMMKPLHSARLSSTEIMATILLERPGTTASLLITRIQGQSSGLTHLK